MTFIHEVAKAVKRGLALVLTGKFITLVTPTGKETIFVVIFDVE